MEKKKIDLHIHSNYSDGELNIFDIIELAKSYGLSTIAITDHDTVINLRDIDKIAKLYGIDIIPGIEISVGKPFNMHILGYGIKNFEKVEAYLREIKNRNIAICEKVVKLLQEDGYEISLEEIYENMHTRRSQNIRETERIKRKSKELGIESLDIEPSDEIFDKRCIAKLLVEKGYARNNKEVYDVIMGQGCKNYIPIYKISARDTINLIHEAGGVVVLAHPFTINLSQEKLEELIKQLKELGLDGIEILNAGTYSEQQTNILRVLADKYKLIETIGTDFHRTSDQNNFLGIDTNQAFLDRLLLAIEARNKEYNEKGKKGNGR